MSQTPTYPHFPAFTLRGDCQWDDCSQMIGARNHMQNGSKRACYNGETKIHELYFLFEFKKKDGIELKPAKF